MVKVFIRSDGRIWEDGRMAMVMFISNSEIHQDHSWSTNIPQLPSNHWTYAAKFIITIEIREISISFKQQQQQQKKKKNMVVHLIFCCTSSSKLYTKKMSPFLCHKVCAWRNTSLFSHLFHRLCGLYPGHFCCHLRALFAKSLWAKREAGAACATTWRQSGGNHSVEANLTVDG